MSLTETESQAAAAVADAILGDWQAMSGDDVPAAEPVAEAVTPPVEAPSTPASIPAPAAPAAETPPAEQPEATEVPSFEPDLPEDLAELLATPDFEAEAAAEVAAHVEANPDVYIDTESTASELAKDKRIKFLEDQLVARSRKNWVEENLRAYPLLRTYAKAEVEAFTATSRRAFARDAQTLNARLETIAKPMLTDLAALKASLKTAAIAEGKTEAAARWGAPPGDVPGAGSHAATAAELEAAEKTGDLTEIFKVMLKG